MRIAIVGHGRMGRAVEALARARGHEIAAVIDATDNPDGRGLTAERLAGAEVAIEFTRPETAAANIAALVELGVPVVCGTTGWSDHLPAIRALAESRGAAVLVASNFSIGAQVVFRAARALTVLLRDRPEFDGFIVETHHRLKRDAPSGTALTLQAAARAGDPSRPLPITSVRGGSVPGTHTLTFDAPDETIVLEHRARSRDVFAAGALAAAEWLPGRPGFHTFEAMLFGSDAGGDA